MFSNRALSSNKDKRLLSFKGHLTEQGSIIENVEIHLEVKKKCYIKWGYMESVLKQLKKKEKR